MREIKFRGRVVSSPFGADLKKGDWVYGHYVAHEDDHYILIPHEGKGQWHWWIKVAPETVGQFTGIQDKNKVYLYGGDIVMEKSLVCEISDSCCSAPGNTEFCAGHHIKESSFVVNMDWCFDNNLFALELAKQVPECADVDEWADEISLLVPYVIGNVHQHSHLLK